MIRSDSITKLAPALLAAQKKMGVALKDAKNPFFKSMYADLNSVIDAAVPTLNDSDITVLQNPTVLDNGKAVLETILLHTSGEYIASQTEIICAKQNDPQAYGSAVSYSRRYGLQSTITLKAEDSDAEDAMTRPAKVAVAAKVVAVEPAKVAEASLTGQSAVANSIVPAKKVSFNKKAIGGAANAGDI